MLNQALKIGVPTRPATLDRAKLCQMVYQTQVNALRGRTPGFDGMLTATVHVGRVLLASESLCWGVLAVPKRVPLVTRV